MSTDTTFCSHRLGTISHIKLQAALDRFELGHLLEVTPVTQGNFGQNVFLTSDQGRFVLRGRPHYPWQFPKEAMFAELLHDHTTVPVPWPYLVEYDESLFGWSYVIMPRMPGIQIGDPSISALLPASDRLAIARALGETLARLQDLTNAFCGEFDLASNSIKPFNESHRERIRSQLEGHMREAVHDHASLTAQEAEWILGLVAAADAFLSDDFVPTFVMQDYREGNVVVEQRDDAWAVSGVFDFMEPYYSDGEIDICRNLCCYVEEDGSDLGRAAAFVEGYAELRPFRPGALMRFPVYLILDRFIIWNFGQRHGVWWEADLSFRDWIDLETHLEAFQMGAAVDEATWHH
jgi:hygromycin-B 7''-O-kinase